MDIEASQVINLTGGKGLASGTYKGHEEETMKKGVSSFLCSSCVKDPTVAEILLTALEAALSYEVTNVLFSYGWNGSHSRLFCLVQAHWISYILS